MGGVGALTEAGEEGRELSYRDSLAGLAVSQ